jgi:hypothetical protein
MNSKETVTVSEEDNERITFGTGPNQLIVDLLEDVEAKKPSQRWKAYVETPTGMLGTFVGGTKKEAKRGAFRYLKRVREWLAPLDSYNG